MHRKRISSCILQTLGDEQRTIVADWRFFVIYDCVARHQGFSPPDRARVKSVVRDLLAEGSISQLEDVGGVYLVTVPYASSIPVSDEAILQEANPTAVLSHLSAFAYHELIDEVPGDLCATHYGNSTARPPLGTTAEDWLDVPAPRYRLVATLRGRRVNWLRPTDPADFGVMIGHAKGAPIYVTDLERTLVDSLRFPKRCGDVLAVVRAWARAAPLIRVDEIVKYAERLGQALLCQRVGFVLEKLGARRQTLDEWAQRSKRGGSAKLIADRPFASAHSERWNLSINIPSNLLAELRAK